MDTHARYLDGLVCVLKIMMEKFANFVIVISL